MRKRERLGGDGPGPLPGSLLGGTCDGKEIHHINYLRATSLETTLQFPASWSHPFDLPYSVELWDDEDRQRELEQSGSLSFLLARSGNLGATVSAVALAGQVVAPKHPMQTAKVQSRADAPGHQPSFVAPRPQRA